MLGHLLFETVLNAPDLAKMAGETAAPLVEQVGRRLAAGMLDEWTERGASALGRWANVASSTVHPSETWAARLGQALQQEQVALVSAQELADLRAVAEAVQRGEGVPEALARWQATRPAASA